MSNLSDRERLLRTAADFASADKRDARTAARLKQVASSRNVSDSVAYSTILNYGRDLMAQGRQATAFELFTQLTHINIEDSDEKQYTNFVLGLYLLLGASADEIGMMNLGLEYYTRGLSMAEACKNERMMASFLNNIGVCYFRVKDLKRSEDYIRRSLALNMKHKSRRDLFLNYNNLAEIELGKNHTESALDNSLLALQQLQDQTRQDADLYYYMQSNIGVLYTKKKDFGLAESYLTNAMVHQRELGFNSDLFETYMNFSDLFKAKNMLDSAEYYATQARLITGQLDNAMLVSRAMEQQARIEELQGDYEKSSGLLSDAYALRDSLRMAENRNRMEQCQRIYEIERANSADKSLMAQWNPVVVFFVMFGILVVMIFILVKLFIYKRNRDRAIKEKVALNREIQQVHEKQIQDARRSKEELQQALDLTHRQLTTFTMDKLRSKEIQGDIVADLRKLLLDINPRSKEVRNEIEVIIRKLSRFNAGDDWTEFHYYFEKVNPSFYRRLMDKHPNITEKEKRLCAFLALGLSSKEIAQITFREVRSIESSRNRLRKKLDLAADANLTEYCKEFTI